MLPDGVVAQRTLDLSGNPTRKVTVLIKQPKPDGDNYRCDYEIVGLIHGKTRSSYAMGSDSMQALMLGLKMIGTDLYTSAAFKDGRLSLEGSQNLDLPVPEVIADLVPKG